MQNILLMAAVAAILIAGWFFTKRMENFLKENDTETQQDEVAVTGRGGFSIGFENPFAAQSIANALEKFSAKYPGVPVQFLGGSREELICGLTENRLDLIFLSEMDDFSERMGYNSRKVTMCSSSLNVNDGGPAVAPIVQGRIVQKAVWRKREEYIDCFLNWMKGYGDE